MATAKKTPAAKTSTEVATVKKTGTGVASIQARIAELAERNKGKVEPAGGNVIRATQDKTFKVPNVGEVTELDIVALEFCSTQTYYPAGYNEKNLNPPDCFAIGNDPKNLVPSPNSPNLQVKKGEGCNKCPHFQWGSGTNGEGKECKSGRRIVVLPGDDETPETTSLMVMNASPTAIKGWDGLVAGFTRMGAIPPQFKIHVDFNPAVKHASMRFSDPQPNSFLDAAVGRIEEAEELLKKEPDVTGWKPYVAPKGARR